MSTPLESWGGQAGANARDLSDADRPSADILAMKRVSFLPSDVRCRQQNQDQAPP